MKKLALLTAFGLAFVSSSVFAHEEEYGDDQRPHYMRAYHRDLSYEINHINRMFAHVRWQMNRYGADWLTRGEKSVTFPVN